MNLQQAVLAGYLILPVLALAFCSVWASRAWAGRCGEGLCALRMVLMLVLLRWTAEAPVGLSVPVVDVLGIDASFQISQERGLFLLVSELIWLFCHIAGFARSGGLGSIRALAIFLQMTVSVVVLSGNLFVMATALLLSVTANFFLLRFVGEEERVEGGSGLAASAFLLQAIVCAALLGWALGQLGFAGADITRSAFRAFETDGNPFVWASLALLFLWLPVWPWSRWYSRLLEVFPEPVSLAATVLICAGAFRLVEIGSIVYPRAQPGHYRALYFFGYGAALLLFSGFFSRATKRSMLAEMPKIMLAMIPLMVGVSSGRDLVTPLVISVFAPAFTMVALVASVVEKGTQINRMFVFLFLYLVYGMPGSPVFLLFGYLGSQSVANGAPWIVAFGLLWFLYFFSAVHLARRMFVDERVAAVGGMPFLPGSSPLVVGFAAVMGVVASVVVWMFGVGI
ncbi:MAG: hypothetical protein HUU37_00525 [Bdellovibrionales bacterium]|nr:hypothetical protein [Bdellovibrionales bacterium]